MKHTFKWVIFGDGIEIPMCNTCWCQLTTKSKDGECSGVARSNTTKARQASDVFRHMQKDRARECSN